MKLLLFFILAVLWLGVMFKWQMRKDVPRERLSQFAGERGKWNTGPCHCGSQRREWEPLEVGRENFTLLLRCRQCGQFWEEKMEGKALNRWREVDETHVRTFYVFEPPEKCEQPMA